MVVGFICWLAVDNQLKKLNDDGLVPLPVIHVVLLWKRLPIQHWDGISTGQAPCSPSQLSHTCYNCMSRRELQFILSNFFIFLPQ